MPGRLLVSTLGQTGDDLPVAAAYTSNLATMTVGPLQRLWASARDPGHLEWVMTNSRGRTAVTT